MKNFRSCGGGSITIPSALPSLRSNFPSGVVVSGPRLSVAKSILSPRTRSVSGAPKNAPVRWSRPPFIARSGGRRPETKGRADASPTLCGKARHSSARRAARARAAGEPALAPDTFEAGRPRSVAAQTRGARPDTRTWLPKTRTASERVRVRPIRTSLEVVACGEAVHALQKLRLGHPGVIESDALIVQAQPVGEILDRPARIVDVTDPERQEPVELELPAGVFDPGAVGKERPVHARRDEHTIKLRLERRHGDSELHVAPQGIGLVRVDVGNIWTEVLDHEAHRRLQLRKLVEGANISGERRARPLRAVLRFVGRREVDAHELQGDAETHVLHQLGTVGERRGDLIARKGAQLVSVHIGRDALAVAQIPEAEPDPAPAFHVLGIGGV